MPGAEQRFEALYAAHADAVYRYALRRVPDAAEDVVAEVFVVAWRRLADVPADDALPWLLAVARRTLANHLRGEQRRGALTQRLGRERPPAQEQDTLDPAVSAALATLPERDRELLMLLAWEGLDHAGAAEVLGISTPNVAVRLHRARRKFERALVNPVRPTVSEESLHV